MSLASKNLIEALCAYICTFRDRSSLVEYINKHDLESYSDEITSTLDALITTAVDYLWGYPGGVPWTDVFKAEYRSHLQHAHPLLDSRGFDRIIWFSRWLCWHEGPNVQQPPP